MLRSIRLYLLSCYLYLHQPQSDLYLDCSWPESSRRGGNECLYVQYMFIDRNVKQQSSAGCRKRKQGSRRQVKLPRRRHVFPAWNQKLVRRELSATSTGPSPQTARTRAILALVQTSHTSPFRRPFREGNSLALANREDISPTVRSPSPQPRYQPPIYHAANQRGKEVRSLVGDTIMQVLRDLLRNLNNNLML